MSSSLRRILVAWATVYLLSFAIGDKMMLARPTPCLHNARDEADDECSICVVASDESHKQGQILMNYVHDGDIVFNDSGTNYLSWKYNDYSVNDPYNITVSFNIWDKKAKMGRAIRGCCGIPLSSGGCYVQDCLQGTTFLTVGYRQWTVAKAFKMNTMRTCAPAVQERPYARYFHICVHELTNWRERYNCQCAVYDSVSGALKPGNHTSELIKNETEKGVWYLDEEPKQYQVCIFSMNKDDVIARGSLADNDDVIDSVAFNRGVFYMKNFSGSNGSVIDDLKGKNVNCILHSFKGGEMFNISSIDLSKHLRTSDNETFTCLAPWPNGTPEFRPQGTHVKCMPQNATYSMSHLYAKNMKATNSFVSTMSVFIPLLGAIALLAVICVLALTLRKKFNKFMKEMQVVPKELDSVMKESYDDFASRLHFGEEKEQCQAFDREEKDRIMSLRQKEEKSEVYETSSRLHFCDDAFRPGYGSPPTFLNIKALHSDLFSSNVIVDPSFVMCRQGMKTPDSFKSDDSGCRISFGSRQSIISDDEPSSPDLPYMVRHVSDETETCGKGFPLELDAKKLKEVSVVMCDVPTCDGYWTKQSFRKKSVSDSVSRCSDDTGCGFDSENEEECLSSKKHGVESKKPPFVKSSSKDSGVVTDRMCANSLRDSMSDFSDDMIEEEEFNYSPKAFQGKYPEHIIVSCITAH